MRTVNVGASVGGESLREGEAAEGSEGSETGESAHMMDDGVLLDEVECIVAVVEDEEHKNGSFSRSLMAARDACAAVIRRAESSKAGIFVKTYWQEAAVVVAVAQLVWTVLKGTQYRLLVPARVTAAEGHQSATGELGSTVIGTYLPTIACVFKAGWEGIKLAKYRAHVRQQVGVEARAAISTTSVV
ncbi:hypothetical protein JCM11641_003259 [Rhodosporidiobolus odoratus]